PIRVRRVPSSHESDRLSRAARQTVRCAGDDTQLEHHHDDRADLERPEEESGQWQSADRAGAVVDRDLHRGAHDVANAHSGDAHGGERARAVARQTVRLREARARRGDAAMTAAALRVGRAEQVAVRTMAAAVHGGVTSLAGAHAHTGETLARLARLWARARL